MGVVSYSFLVRSNDFLWSPVVHFFTWQQLRAKKQSGEKKTL